MNHPRQKHVVDTRDQQEWLNSGSTSSCSSSTLEVDSNPASVCPDCLQKLLALLLVAKSFDVHLQA
jgi:hypothetical protein